MVTVDISSRRLVGRKTENPRNVPAGINKRLTLFTRFLIAKRFKNKDCARIPEGDAVDLGYMGSANCGSKRDGGLHAKE